MVARRSTDDCEFRPRRAAVPLRPPTLDKLIPVADLLVVSANPKEILNSEWEEHDLARYVQAICGQETGTKKDILANACKYPAGHTLMIGDAPARLLGGLGQRGLVFSH